MQTQNSNIDNIDNAEEEFKNLTVNKSINTKTSASKGEE